MSAEIFNLRDYQSKRALADLSQKVVDETAKTFEAEFGYPLSPTEFSARLAVWPDFSQANAHHAPDKDSA